jgi:hypothetical protein
VSYLQQLFNAQQSPVIRTHNSIESLINALVPGLKSPEKPREKEQINEKARAESFERAEEIEKMLRTPSEKVLAEKVEKEIEEDLQEAFLNEAISMHEAIDASSYYKIYRDRDEIFECKISVEGATLSNAFVRLILETETWNILFTGKIYRDGRCVVPLKKMTIFEEGTIGKAHLEIIIDDAIFVPWEDKFKVEGAKKVKVEIAPQTKISVNLKGEE